MTKIEPVLELVKSVLDFNYGAELVKIEVEKIDTATFMGNPEVVVWAHAHLTDGRRKAVELIASIGKGGDVALRKLDIITVVQGEPTLHGLDDILGNTE